MSRLRCSVNYLLWVPIVGFLVWVVLWRMPFETMERIYGLLGLALIVFAIALWKLGPDWTYLYYAIALFGAAMTPYEVFFFSSGAVEEHWTTKNLATARLNVFIGFPLGGLLSLSIMGCAAVVLQPQGIEVDHLSQIGLPVAVALGKLGIAAALLGFFAATFGAALETLLSAGYTIAQFFGWPWGKFVRPVEAARFHVVALVTLFGGMALILTTIDPVKVTEYSIVLSAAALPLTYFPILLIANDRGYLGEHTNGRVTNVFGTAYLLLILVVSLVTIPLMLATKAGL